MNFCTRAETSQPEPEMTSTISEDSLEEKGSHIKSYNCNYCGKSFKREKDLQQHIIIHTENLLSVIIVIENVVTQVVCQLIFGLSQVTSFTNVNIVTKHSSSYFVFCILLTHVSVHTGEKPYNCKHCERKFRYKSNLKYDVKTHIGENFFKCQTCKHAIGCQLV